MHRSSDQRPASEWWSDVYGVATIATQDGAKERRLVMLVRLSGTWGSGRGGPAEPVEAQAEFDVWLDELDPKVADGLFAAFVFDRPR